MSYAVDYSPKAIKFLKKLDKNTRSTILDWIDKHLDGCADPRETGKGLTSNLSGKWRYRVGQYRLLAKISDQELVILLVDIEHRDKVYRN